MPESYVQTSNFKFEGHWRHDAADSGAEARAIDGISCRILFQDLQALTAPEGTIARGSFPELLAGQ